MKIKNGFVLREVAGKSVVVPIGEMSKDFHGMINLNETGAFLWNFFKEDHTEEDAVNAIMKEYDADEEMVRSDVKQFVELLIANKFTE